MPAAKEFGSYAGSDDSASTSPLRRRERDRGAAEPVVPEGLLGGALDVAVDRQLQAAPSTGSSSPSTSISRPRLLTITWRAPSAPISSGL